MLQTLISMQVLEHIGYIAFFVFSFHVGPLGFLTVP